MTVRHGRIVRDPRNDTVRRVACDGRIREEHTESGDPRSDAMQINAERVVEFRKKCSWSQDELATAAGLNLRTIQRVENSGTASLQTLKAIAAALEAELEDFRSNPERS